MSHAAIGTKVNLMVRLLELGSEVKSTKSSWSCIISIVVVTITCWAEEHILYTNLLPKSRLCLLPSKLTNAVAISLVVAAIFVSVTATDVVVTVASSVIVTNIAVAIL